MQLNNGRLETIYWWTISHTCITKTVVAATRAEAKVRFRTLYGPIPKDAKIIRTL